MSVLLGGQYQVSYYAANLKRLLLSFDFEFAVACLDCCFTWQLDGRTASPFSTCIVIDFQRLSLIASTFKPHVNVEVKTCCYAGLRFCSFGLLQVMFKMSAVTENPLWLRAM